MHFDQKPLDAYDAKIIDALLENGRQTITELADKVGLTKTPTLSRLRRLETEGVITGYSAVVNQAKLGFAHIAFVEVKLSHTQEPALAEFNRAVRKIPEIEQAHMMASSFDYLLKIRCKDMEAYRKVLGERVSTLPYVASTSSLIAMQEVK